MSEFVWIRNGDTLPAVAVAQMLLNARNAAGLSVDGIYGTRTTEAVRQFQSARRLSADGVIGRDTWPRLSSADQLPILDSIDVFDPDLYTSEAALLRGTGANPLLIGGMCNGIEQAVTNIAGSTSNLFLLRFHGHGAPGAAGASDGHGDFEDHSTFRNDPATRRALTRLRSCFGPYGCIQFMHCNVAQGRDGAQFLRMVADVVGVPASAAIQTQYGSTLRETVRFEGPTRTVCPGGATIRDWAATLLPFTPMSVP
jgi:Putative peptidoglycan binding domain